MDFQFSNVRESHHYRIDQTSITVFPNIKGYRFRILLESVEVTNRPDPFNYTFRSFMCERGAAHAAQYDQKPENDERVYSLLFRRQLNR